MKEPRCPPDVRTPTLRLTATRENCTTEDTMIDAPIKTLAPWFGGKRTLAPVIVGELGRHSSYFEPFVGGMSVILQKPQSHHENVNDLHGDLINLARAIKDPQVGPALYRRLRRTLLHEEIHADARAGVLEDWEPEPEPDLDRAYWYFVYSWIGRNGTAGTNCLNSGFCKRWTPHGGHGGQRFKSAIRSIPAWRRRMSNLTITRMDGFEFLEKIEDCPGVSIYCDPPYLVKGAKYVHDFDDEDHARLASTLERFTNTRVVVSYYDHPRLKELYPGWTTRKIEISKATAHQGQRGGNDARAVEVLLMNGPSYEEKSTGLFAG